MTARTIRLAFLLLILVVYSSCNESSAQEQCGTESLHERLFKTDAQYKANFQRAQQQIQNIIRSRSFEKISEEVYTIPVVVHVMNLGEPIGVGTNISDAQILGAINGLNNRFRNLVGNSLDIKLEFKLAKRDPNGCPTTGINRVNGSNIPNYQLNGISASSDTCNAPANEKLVKDLSRWPVTQYYNIWVVNKICGGWAGYAYYPSGGAYDGSTIGYLYMKESDVTLTHELGHGFNVYHTFQGDNNNSQCPVDTTCTLNGDQVCDTPPHKQSDCGTQNPCSTLGIWDNSTRNYMSYCSSRDRFTSGQKDRMRAAILVYPRADLLKSQGCVPSDFETVILKSNVSCNGACDGTVKLNPLCPGIYTYKWNTGDTSSVLTNLCAAIYNVSIKDTNGATADLAVDISQPSPIAISADVTDASCFGKHDGTAKVNVTGGTPFKYGKPFHLEIGKEAQTLGNSYYPAPFGNYYLSARHQMLYLAQELKEQGFTSGRITALALNVASISGSTLYNDFQVKIGTTSLSAISSFQNSLMIGYFSKEITINVGWNTFQLNNPFVWDGHSNVIVEFCFVNTSTSANSPVFFTNTSFSSVVYGFGNSPKCDDNQSGWRFWNVRPNIRFEVNRDTSYYEYYWNSGQSSDIVMNLAAGKYSVIAVDSNNCTATADFVISQPPIVQAPDVISGPTTVCEGTNQFFSISPSGSATTFVWSLPISWTGNSSTDSISTTVGAFGGHVAVKAVEGNCSSTERSLDVMVISLPLKPDSIKGMKNVCIGTTQIYSVPHDDRASSYTWTLPVGWVGYSTTDSIEVKTGSSGGRVTVKANNICGSSLEGQMNVSVMPLPATPGAITGNAVVCAATNQVYIITPVSDATSYNWVLPSGWSGTSTSNTIQVVSGNSGAIAVNGVNGCGNGGNSTLNVTVNTIPNSPGSISGSALVNLGQSANYSINAVPGATKYNWAVSGGGTITNNPVTTADVTWNAAGNFLITVGVENNCGFGGSQSLGVTVMNPTAVINPDNDFHIVVMPNPTHSAFYVKAKGVAGKKIKIEVFDQLGEQIEVIATSSSGNELLKEFNLISIPSGIYMVQITIGEKLYQRRVVKL